MEALDKDPYFTFHPDTLEAVRKSVNIESQEAMHQAIDILELWIKKQDHFIKKDFHRSYLERIIINAKGSVERSKERLDKLCRARTIMPEFFTICNIKNLKLDMVEDTAIPKLTKDYYRVYFIRNLGQEFDAQFLNDFYLRMTYMMEYMLANDYNLGIILISDFRATNLIELVKRMDVVQLANVMSLSLNSFGLRVKGMHFISTSKTVRALVAILKQVLTEKLAQRIYVHSEMEAIYKYVDKELLPADYGGAEESMTELHKSMLDILSSQKFLEYMKAMNEFKTNEALRRKDNLNDQYLGMPGTFRSLTVD